MAQMQQSAAYDGPVPPRSPLAAIAQAADRSRVGRIRSLVNGAFKSRSTGRAAVTRSAAIIEVQ